MKIKTCPYCNKEIEDDLPFCPNCNKPLLVDTNREKVNSSDYFFDNLPFYNPNFEEKYEKEEMDEFDNQELSNPSIDDQIREIDDQINKKAENDQFIGKLLLEKASLYYKKRDLRTALKILEIALSNLEHNRDLSYSKYSAICYNEMGIIKEDMGYYEDSIYYFNNAASLLKDFGDYEKLIQVYNNLGNAYYQIKDIENSYKYYQKAIDKAEEIGLIFDEVKSSSNLVEVLLILEDYDRVKRILLGESYFQKSEDCFFDALKLIKTIENQISRFTKARLEWECTFYLGKINLFKDKEIEAEDYLLTSLEAIRTFEYGGLHIKEGVVLEALANLYEFKSNPQEAINYYNLATEIYNKFGEEIKISQIYNKIALLYLKDLEDHIEAINFLEKSLNIYESLDYLKESAEVLDQIGDIYVNKDMINLAIKSFREARIIYNDLNDTYHSQIINEKINSLKN
ncbi:MAG: tetratricopeptide repeat protein [Candidatus Lokiarchaeota archaeon]